MPLYTLESMKRAGRLLSGPRTTASISSRISYLGGASLPTQRCISPLHRVHL